MESSRIDLWLKLVCLYRQRSEAAEACSGGHVRINERRAKPASPVKVNDLVELTEGHYRRLVVVGVPLRHVSKSEARTMYRDETPEQPKEVRIRVAMRDKGAGRPTKRERRQLERWRR
jgi:ribosome-associated heat shock protein Hsp15